MQLEVLGGGRMEHHPDQQVLSIYGYSTGFGQAPHEVTAAIAKRLVETGMVDYVSFTAGNNTRKLARVDHWPPTPAPSPFKGLTLSPY